VCASLIATEALVAILREGFKSQSVPSIGYPLNCSAVLNLTRLLGLGQWLALSTAETDDEDAFQT
jgi:hypothetical protein